MFEICGTPVERSDAWWLVDELRTIGRADDVIAAATIESGLWHSDEVDLSPSQREAVLDLLVSCPVSLDGLRGTLLRDHRDRSRAP
jgi:hypothetical protein